jgi:hypothetical protein
VWASKPVTKTVSNTVWRSGGTGTTGIRDLSVEHPATACG